MFHILVIDRGDRSIECFNRSIHNYSVVAAGSMSN